MKIVSLYRSFSVAPFRVPTIKRMFNSQRMCQCLELVQAKKPQTHGSQETPRDTGASLWKDNTRKVMKKFHSAGKNEKSTFWHVEFKGKPWVENF